MRIPGLDEAFAKLNVFEEQMLPLLERIANGVDELVALEKSRQGIDE